MHSKFELHLKLKKDCCQPELLLLFTFFQFFESFVQCVNNHIQALLQPLQGYHSIYHSAVASLNINGRPYWERNQEAIYSQQNLSCFSKIILAKEVKDLYDENFKAPKNEIKVSERWEDIHACGLVVVRL